MIVELTPEQEAYIRDAIASGRLRSVDDAICQAMVLWEQRERARAEVLASVDAADAALARGEGRMITEESVRDLAAEVKQRGRRLLLR